MSTANKTRRSRCQPPPRSVRRPGAAVIELAVCLPLIVVLVFGSLEGANMLFVRQAAVQAAYESVKVAAKSTGSQARAETIAEEVLSARRITKDALVFSPSNVDGLAAGTPITVTVRVPGDSRTLLGFGPFGGIMIEAQATMLKE